MAPCCTRYTDLLFEVPSFHASDRTELHKQTHTCLSGSTPNDPAKIKSISYSSLGPNHVLCQAPLRQEMLLEKAYSCLNVLKVSFSLRENRLDRVLYFLLVLPCKG